MIPATRPEPTSSASASFTRGIGSIKYAPPDVPRQVEYSSALTAESYSCQIAIFEAIRSKSDNDRTGLASSFRIYGEMFVLQTFGDPFGLFHLDLFACGIERVIS